MRIVTVASKLRLQVVFVLADVYAEVVDERGRDMVNGVLSVVEKVTAIAKACSVYFR